VRSYCSDVKFIGLDESAQLIEIRLEPLRLLDHLGTVPPRADHPATASRTHVSTAGATKAVIRYGATMTTARQPRGSA
jgi:hypothetical protein